jgi:hypothetical protein
MTTEVRLLPTNLTGPDGPIPPGTRQAVDAAGAEHPDFGVIRGCDWAGRAAHAFDPRLPRLDESSPASTTNEAWGWCRGAWTALLAPQLVSIGEGSSRETEPFTFGYLSGAPAALVELLGIEPGSWLATSIIVGPHADVFGKDALFEAHQLCATITAAGDCWPTATRTNNFETGWKAGYVEMLDLLSGDRPAGLLGRFLREGLEVVDRPIRARDERRFAS